MSPFCKHNSKKMPFRRTLILFTIRFFAKGAQAQEEGRSRSGSYGLEKQAAAMGLSDSPLELDDTAAATESNRATEASRVTEQLETSATASSSAEITRGRAEDLRNAVEEVRSATIMMELSLDGSLFHYLSPVWEDVVGVDPVECLGHPISDMLHPSDENLFNEATEQLLSDDSHTVEVRFRLRVAVESGAVGDLEEDEQSGERSFVWEAMEGKGMCIHDRESGEATHTM